MPSSKPARRFEDILQNCRAIEQYTQGMDLRRFTADAKTRDAVERCLERISEAASKLAEAAPALAPEQPWPQIAALGNRIRHEYDRLRVERLWEIVTSDLPSLRNACQTALKKLRDRERSSQPEG
jgi:uncharacterized protein with HEPN domain